MSVRYGDPVYPNEGETHQAFSVRMSQAVAVLLDEDKTTWWESLRRAEQGATPAIIGPQGPEWRRKWDGSRPVPRRSPDRTWE